MTATGADLLVAALEQAGVEVVFGLPGVHNLPAWRALEASDIRVVCVRHEQAAVYAADGYSRATGRLGVALVTTGPGAANTLGAVGEAWASRSPVLVIATDIPTTLRRPGVIGGALHECADQAAMFAPVTVARARIAAAAEIPGAVETLVAGCSRPVYLEVPADLLASRGEPERADCDIGRASRGSDRSQPAEDAIARATDLLAASNRPLVWAGGGARDARAEVAALAERLGAPILTTYTGRGVAGDHPLAVGLPPHIPEAGALWDEADLVIAVGSDLDGMNTQDWRMPPPPVLVAVNTDPSDASKNYAPALVVDGDAAIACELLAGRIDHPRDPWADLPSVRDRAHSRLRAEHPAEFAFLDAFAAAVPDDAVVLADMCIPGYWLAGFHRFAGPRRLQYPMGWGTLGYAFPASIGAAVAGTGPVVSVSGDGGFLFACGELATFAQEAAPMTALIVDDGAYGMLGLELPGPDFTALARAFGLHSGQVDGLGDEFSAALSEHVADPRPTVLVARARLRPPPTTSPRWYRTGPPRFTRPA